MNETAQSHLTVAKGDQSIMKETAQSHLTAAKGGRSNMKESAQSIKNETVRSN